MSVSAQSFPAKARKFIHTNYPDRCVFAIRTDGDFRIEEYKVCLNDGTRINFDRKGNLKSIKAIHGDSVKLEILPADIAEIIKIQFPNTRIIEYEVEDRGKRKEYHEIVLKDHRELEFIGNFKCKW
jgi:hypothetical protein